MDKFISIFIIIFIDVVVSQNIYYNCKNADGIDGICKMWYDCKTATDQNQYISPGQYGCGNIGNRQGPLVPCCTDVHALLIPNKMDIYFPGMKSNYKKCLEYTAENKRKQSLKFEADALYSIRCHDGICEILLPIMGGTPADIDEFPHMAQIGWERADGKGYEWNCGGSLISEEFVLTAAHCLYVENSELISPEPKVVRLGGQYPNDVKISSCIMHSDYKPPSKYNDIALLKIEKSIEFSLRIRPACIWSDPSLSEDAVAIGWGVTSPGRSKPESLQKVTLSMYDDSVCKRGYPISRSRPQGIADSQFCAGYPSGGRDTCQGDSGGPIQVRNKANEDMLDVIGVTSFGAGCGSTKGGIYTRISHYVDWIEERVWPNETLLFNTLSDMYSL